MKNIIIGIDLGGTNCRIGAVDENNNLSTPHIYKTKLLADSASPVTTLYKMIENYIKKAHIYNITAISIGVPSSVQPDKSTVICTTNIRNQKGEVVFKNTNLSEELESYFHIPVFVNNDINNILLYDVMKNHLEGQKVIVGIYIGTGVGASVLLDGKLLEGKNGAELDIGHIPYYGHTAPCSCGKSGCCECYSSGWKLQSIRSTYFPNTNIEDLFTLHRDETPLKDFISTCANIYAIMATIFNPNSMIVGGGVPEMKDFPRDTFEKQVNLLTGKDVMSFGFDYVYSQPFSGKGIIGAAIFARSLL